VNQIIAPTVEFEGSGRWPIFKFKEGRINEMVIWDFFEGITPKVLAISALKLLAKKARQGHDCNHRQRQSRHSPRKS
jgi:hypothetical protein